MFSHQALEERIKVNYHPEGKEELPVNTPHELYPLLMTSDTSATTPTMLSMITFVGGITSVVTRLRKTVELTFMKLI